MPTLYASTEDVQRIAKCLLGQSRAVKPPCAGRALRAEGIPCQVVGKEVFVLADDLAAWTRGTLNLAASNGPRMHLVNAPLRKSQAD